MIIAINTIVSLKKWQKKQADFFSHYLSAIANKNSAHQFIFIIDDAVEAFNPSSKNVSIVKAKTPANALTAELWHTYQLPKIVKKIKADILINTNALYPIKTNAPQYLVVDNLSIIDRSKKNNIAAFNKAEKTIATSEVLKTALIDRYKIDQQKIEIIYIGATPIFSPLTWEEKQEVLKNYSNGKEYFLCSGDDTKEENLLLLLKAFSLFKKWQKSNMQMIIASKKSSFSKSFTESLKTYKYKEDVIILNDLTQETLVQLFASAYCFINPVDDENYISLLQAMQSETPVITGDNGINKEICNDASLFFNTDSFDHLSKSMILIYKDEDKRNELIEKGIVQAKKCSYTNTINTLTQLLQ